MKPTLPAGRQTAADPPNTVVDVTASLPAHGRASGPAAPPAAGVRQVAGVRAQTTIIVLIALMVLLYQIQSIILPFVLAGAVAYAASPGVDWLSRGLRLPRKLAAGLMFLLLAGLAVGLGVLVLPPVLAEGWDLMTNFEATLRRAAHAALGSGTVDFFGEHLSADDIASRTAQAARDWLSGADRAVALANLSVSAVFGFFITLVLLLYFLVGGPELGRGLFRLLPPGHRAVADRVWVQLDPLLKRYFIGIAIVVTYASVAAYIGLGPVLGIPEAGILAILSGVLEIVPIVGPIASALLVGLAALQAAANSEAVLAFLIYFTIFRLTVDQLVGPLILGRAGHIHPALVIFCFLAGGLLFGVAGVILAVPVALAVRTFLRVLYAEPAMTEGVPGDGS